VPDSGFRNAWRNLPTRDRNLNCQETQTLIHGYVDGELELTKSLDIDQHLHECEACAQACADLRALRTAIRDGAPYFQAPPTLRKRIQSSLRKTSNVRPITPVYLWRALAIAACVAFVFIAGWALQRALSPRSDEPFLTRELLASHIRSQMLPGHQVDIASSNQHVVKPWFDGKLDFSPAVKDFTEQGFPLVGGRLDYLDNRQVAALIYKRREHIINLFVWPRAPGSNATPPRLTRQGYHLIHWTQAGMNWWAVSNLNETESQEFVDLVQHALGAGP
jgi:anti-sigma factor RsiW